jgi:hypothetical protein
MYSQIFVTSILDIPQQIGIFAGAVGFTVNNSNPNQPIITHPTFPGALPIRVRASISGTNNQNHDLIFESTNPLATSSAVTRSPKLAGATNNPTVPAPTSIHLFGKLSEPFIACVIEYGPNRYRHSYLGYLEKAFPYNGGEVIAGTAGPDSTPAATISYTAGNVKYLFGGKTTLLATATSGGVHIDHPNAPTPWLVNRIPSTGNVMTAFTNAMVLGGFKDGYNDPFVARGQSSYAGAAILTPVNMFTAQPISGDCRFIPLGAPYNARLVNMRNLSPGQTVDIAGELWKCFPAMTKRTETTMPLGGGNYRQYETSFEIGYAYREN